MMRETLRMILLTFVLFTDGGGSNFLNKDIKKVKILPMKSKTMSETVKLTISNLNKSNYMLVMPDTYYTDDQPYQLLISSRINKVDSVICWSNRPSQLGKLDDVAV